MGLLDSVIGALGSQQPGGGQGDLLGAVIGMLGQQSSGGLGGLGGLLQKFEQAGLGHVASSWVGTGANQPVTPDQLGGVLGGDVVANAFIPTLVELHLQGRFPFDKLCRFYAFDQVNKAMADSESGITIKPILRMPAAADLA